MAATKSPSRSIDGVGDGLVVLVDRVEHTFVETKGTSRRVSYPPLRLLTWQPY